MAGLVRAGGRAYMSRVKDARPTAAPAFGQSLSVLNGPLLANPDMIVGIGKAESDLRGPTGH